MTYMVKFYIKTEFLLLRLSDWHCWFKYGPFMLAVIFFFYVTCPCLTINYCSTGQLDWAMNLNKQFDEIDYKIEDIVFV